MKLYFAPGACSPAVHISLIGAGIDFKPVMVQMATKTTADGVDFHTINARGVVPVLELDDGARITEVAAILQYVADLAPDSGLAPAPGSFARVRLTEALNLISAEIHKSWSPRFNPAFDHVAKDFFTQKLRTQYGLLDSRLSSAEWLLGDNISVADYYLFVTLLWRNFLPLDMDDTPSLEAYVRRIYERPAVRIAMTVEGLI